MVVIEILQKVRGESEQRLEQLAAGSSRIYEITTAGTIVERTHQLRDFYELILRQLGQAIELLGVRDAQRRG